jgi:hypothetical protein
MKKNIIFYNDFHHGDLHYIRPFVRDICKKLKTICGNFYYYHNFSYLDDILSELNDVAIRIPSLNLPVHGGIYSDDKNIYINTWTGHNNHKYLEKATSIYSNYYMFGEIYDFISKDLNFKIELDSIENYVPVIDFSKLNIDYKKNIEAFYNNHKNKIIILVANGLVHSGQCLNFDFGDIVNKLSIESSEYIFICTCKNFAPKTEYVYFTDDIINKGYSDLNEISYLSKFCRIIIGRQSGPFCLTHIKENLINKEKIFISFCHNKYDGEMVPSESKMVWTNNYSLENILNTIKKEINILN